MYRYICCVTTCSRFFFRINRVENKLNINVVVCTYCGLPEWPLGGAVYIIGAGKCGSLVVFCLTGSAEGDKKSLYFWFVSRRLLLTRDTSRKLVTSQNNKDGRSRKQQLLGR